MTKLNTTSETSNVEIGKSLLAVFSDLPDPRSARGIRHKLSDIVVISILAFICGADDYVDIRTYGLANEAWLRTFLALEHGIPSVDTLERVFAILQPEAWQGKFLDWTRHTVLGLEDEDGGDDIIAIDGKTACSSGTANQAALHTVSAWTSQGGIVLGQETVASKSNEITAIPELLSVLAPAGAVVTCDAMGTQKDIAWTIREYHADYLLALKDNHPKLHQDAQWLFDQAEQYPDTLASYSSTESRSANNYDRRECWVMDDLSFLELHTHNAWRDLTSLVKVRRTYQQQGETHTQDRFYLSSLPADAERALHAARSHWGIENQLHWVLDVVFKEDASQVHRGNAQANLVSLRHTALNILKQDRGSKASIKSKRKRAGWDRDYLLTLLGLG